MKITIVAGARPNFMKISPIIRAIEKLKTSTKPIDYRLVHTGQHYDANLSDTFFEELQIPHPHKNLNIKSGTQAEQTAGIMIGFENELIQNRPDFVIVVGDVTSTMACAIVTKKANISLIHVEAGIRSGDLTMPEEINRMVTDSITDYFFTTSEIANQNLIKSGHLKENVFFVGNVMIDTLLQNLNHIKKPSFWDDLILETEKYYLLTLHRPSNVDEASSFIELLIDISIHAGDIPIVFPVHPRTQQILRETKKDFPNYHFVEPQGYLSFIYALKNSKAILTDSGGITEEASILNVPCITFRNSTERPETCELGTNVLVGNNKKKISEAFQKLKNSQWPDGKSIPLWDGKASERIISTLIKIYYE
jgi:UDP-N-acetylglucosamine 2-epimerase (non-hydrolysing)